MSILQALLLGLLQGAAEFLPVSSSGHLVLARTLMGLDDIPVLFDVLLHLATLGVVMWVFRARIAAVLGAVMRLLRRRSRGGDGPLLILALCLITASAVTALLGTALQRLNFANPPALVGLCFILTAAVLLSTRWCRGTRSLEGMGIRRSLVLGAAQGAAVLPGISRSGITIAAGLLLGLDRKAAGEFSFLLSIPAVIGAFLFSLKDVAELIPAVPPAAAAAGFLAALASGYGSLKLLLFLMNWGRIRLFALYLLPMGIWVLLRFAG